MNKLNMDLLRKYPAELMLGLLIAYLAGAFVGPLIIKYKGEEAGLPFEKIYSYFCHQRVERSMFILGEDGLINFYSIDELHKMGVIPIENPYVPDSLSDEIFGYPFVGDEQVGYKVALCIRDLSIYFALVLFGLIYIIKYRVRGGSTPRSFRWSLIIGLMIPMIIDGSFQLMGELLDFSWVPVQYYTSIWKRVITGTMFGLGFGMLVFPNLISSNDMIYNRNSKTN